MTNKEIENIRLELKVGIKKLKCRKCGCMKNVLQNILISLPSVEFEKFPELIQDVRNHLKEMKDIEYTCLGCKHCYPAVAMNIFNQTFPEIADSGRLSCDFEIVKQDSSLRLEKAWPPVAGDYFAFCDGTSCPVAVSTLASIELAEKLANIRPKGLCIVGKTETENIGIDKVIKNTITNPTIHFLIVAGKNPDGHHSGKTLLALSKNGVNKDMKIIGSIGKRPILKNVTLSEIDAFCKQVQVIDMIGCEDIKIITDKISELSKKDVLSCKCVECSNETSSVEISTPPKIFASELKKLKMDRAGYFVVIPSLEKKIIVVEHYSYDNKLLHIIEGKDAVSIYSTIIEGGRVTELSHAAYLGRELAKVELSLKYGFKYIQDKAPGKVKENDY